MRGLSYGTHGARAIRKAYAMLLPSYSPKLCYDLISSATMYQIPTVYNVCRNHTLFDSDYTPPAWNTYKKVCMGCGNARDRNRFSADFSTSDGLSNECMYCVMNFGGGYKTEPKHKHVPFDERGEFACYNCGMRVHSETDTDEQWAVYGQSFLNQNEADTCCLVEEVAMD